MAVSINNGWVVDDTNPTSNGSVGPIAAPLSRYSHVDILQSGANYYVALRGISPTPVSYYGGGPWTVRADAEAAHAEAVKVLQKESN